MLKRKKRKNKKTKKERGEGGGERGNTYAISGVLCAGTAPCHMHDKTREILPGQQYKYEKEGYELPLKEGGRNVSLHALVPFFLHIQHGSRESLTFTNSLKWPLKNHYPLHPYIENNNSSWSWR